MKRLDPRQRNGRIAFGSIIALTVVFCLVPLDVVNFLTLLIAVGMFVAVLIRLVFRLTSYVRLRGWRNVPVLLWRDLALFGALSMIFGVGLIARVFGLIVRDNPAYVIPTDIVGIVAIGLFAYVEYFVVEDPIVD